MVSDPKVRVQCQRLLYIACNLFFSVHSKSQDFLKSLRHPRGKHCGVLLNFFVFDVVLVCADIITDTVTAIDFFSRGDISWGALTTFFVIAPFWANLAIFVTNSFRKKKCFVFYAPELIQLFWNFPIFHPVR
jgi:hypothetical protein